MNTILLDLGNTALKWSPMDDPEQQFTIVHGNKGNIEEEIAKIWQQTTPDRVCGCSVGSDWIARRISSEFATRGIGCRWFPADKAFVGDFTVKNRYVDPGLLGADRWFAAIGGVVLHPQEPLLVVHMGTASTVDSIIPDGDKEYVFLGGRIAPGPALMNEGLARGTSHLPRGFGKSMDFPDNTVDAITTGIIDSQLGLIERAVRQMEKIGQAPRVLLAGGAARLISQYAREEFDRMDVRHNLVLHGLAAKVRAELTARQKGG